MKRKALTTIKRIRVKGLKTPKDLQGKDVVVKILLWRLAQNLQETGNPFHHKTADGTIVDADPTNEYLLSRLSGFDGEMITRFWTEHIKPNALPAVPVDRLHYGFDLYNE
jgi:hypothetical protein